MYLMHLGATGPVAAKIGAANDCSRFRLLSEVNDLFLKCILKKINT